MMAEYMRAVSSSSPSAKPRCPTNVKHISRSLFQDIEGGEEGEAGDPPIRVDHQTLRVWADGRPHRVNIPIKYQVCRHLIFLFLQFYVSFPVLSQFSFSLKIRQLFLKDDYGLSGKDEGPKVTPVLDWVYGYRGKDSRANLDKLPTGEVSKMVS